jgi:hypothetical protein
MGVVASGVHFDPKRDRTVTSVRKRRGELSIICWTTACCGLDTSGDPSTRWCRWPGRRFVAAGAAVYRNLSERGSERFLRRSGRAEVLDWAAGSGRDWVGLEPLRAQGRGAGILE